ncbi:hypothetical protein [Streptomyces sp. NPDC002994]|uniref:ATP-dependent DNA ligase n=1 Tax=Streptomyces sp. NPDC002994 TaxID=3154441 RepID=UPI0033B7E697
MPLSCTVPDRTVLCRSFLPEKKQLPHGLVLDGELVVWLCNQLPFDALQRRASSGSRTVQQLAAAMPAHFIAFDILRDPPRRPGGPVRQARPDASVDAVLDDDELGLRPGVAGALDWKSLEWRGW